MAKVYRYRLKHHGQNHNLIYFLDHNPVVIVQLWNQMLHCQPPHSIVGRHHQVLVVAEAPRFRQFAGLIAPLLGAQAATRLARPGADLAGILKSAAFSPGGLALVSSDASPEALDFTRRATGG